MAGKKLELHNRGKNPLRKELIMNSESENLDFYWGGWNGVGYIAGNLNGRGAVKPPNSDRLKRG